MFRFLYPTILFLLVIPLFMAFWQFRRAKKRQGSVRFSSLLFLKGVESSYRARFRHVVPLLRIIAVILAILALARPQTGSSREELSSNGVDILLLMDISTSMRAEDFKPDNRLAVIKNVIEKFISGRKSDRLGVIAFAGTAFTMCPLTLDYDLAVSAVRALDFAPPEEDGTAIGNAVAMAINRLRDSKAKSRVIILATDGDNNKGEIDPGTASKAAAALGIKIYTVGVGKEGPVPYPFDHPFFGRQYQMVEIPFKEEPLREISGNTGALFFRAKNPKMLKEIYEKIDKMEKSEVRSQIFTSYTEWYQFLLVPALILLFLEIILATTLFRRLP
ncbi:MAG: VWA domain-containing protein [Fibrobacteres bacterium]|nr:VWA domain-containing protein [Fibrobacterota bacterium]